MRQSSGTINGLNSVSFIDANTGTVVGYSGAILRTTNGGTTWKSQSIGTNWDIYGVSFPDAETGTVVGYYQPNGPYYDPGGGPGGIILRTTNSGTTWTSISSGLYNVWSMDPLLGLSFTDANNGTVVGYDGMFRTTNGGGIFYNDYIDGQGYWIPQPSVGNALYGVCFTDANTGTVVGYSGTILHTTTGGVTTVKNNPTQLPNQFTLEQNYPNPFNPTTTISFSLPSKSFVSLKVFDIIGREVATIVSEEMSAGIHSRQWIASKMSSGIYFYRLQAHPLSGGQTGTYTETKKLVLLK